LTVPAGFFRRVFCFQILLVLILELSDYENEDDDEAENEAAKP
jgi:hypothetical protein